MREPCVNYDEIASTYDRRYKSGVGEGQQTIPLALRELLSENLKSRILEVGCGTGYWLESFDEPNEIFGIDLSLGMLDRAMKRRQHISLMMVVGRSPKA